MNNSQLLHWSFDYSYGSQSNKYAQELLNLLHVYETQSAYNDTNVNEELPIKHIYQILPNFWRGYKRDNAQEESLSIGAVTIERQLDHKNLLHYNVQYDNTTSGENLNLHFCCQNDIYCSLNGSWRVEANNRCSDNYSTLTWEGYITAEKEIQHIVNGFEICIGTMESSLPLICNWSLFDVIPNLAEKIKKSGDKEKIVLLDDLEQFRPKCKLGYLDSIDLPMPLDGFYLYGTGVLPSYWWIDKKKDIVIVSRVFDTLVLTEKTGSIS